MTTLRRPWEELHAENQRLRDLLDALAEDAIYRRDILVRFSPELFSEMEGEWSEPVRLKTERQADGTYVLIADRVEPAA